MSKFQCPRCHYVIEKKKEPMWVVIFGTAIVAIVLAILVFLCAGLARLAWYFAVG